MYNIKCKHITEWLLSASGASRKSHDVSTSTAKNRPQTGIIHMELAVMLTPEAYMWFKHVVQAVCIHEHDCMTCCADRLLLSGYAGGS